MKWRADRRFLAGLLLSLLCSSSSLASPPAGGSDRAAALVEGVAIAVTASLPDGSPELEGPTAVLAFPRHPVPSLEGALRFEARRGPESPAFRRQLSWPLRC